MKRFVKASDLSVQQAVDAIGRLALVLLHDAGRGSHSAVDMLTIRTGHKWSVVNDNGESFLDTADQTLISRSKGDRFMWQNATLHLDTAIPETILASISGRRLGDVVAGAGFEDRIIAGAVSTEDGISIMVEDETVMLSTIGIGRAAALLSPLRRVWWRILTEMPARVTTRR